MKYQTGSCNEQFLGKSGTGASKRGELRWGSKLKRDAG